MSRVAKKPVDLPQGVTVTVSPASVTVKGSRGSLSLALASGISVAQDDKQLLVKIAEGPASKSLVPTAGSTRAHLANMVTGVSKGFERKLELNGVGYRAQLQGKTLNLTLVKGNDRQLVGQVAAEIRGFRPPEPYKGKGVRYAGEKIVLKEGKKK
jgi:large subunit ribosomal protein L6